MNFILRCSYILSLRLEVIELGGKKRNRREKIMDNVIVYSKAQMEKAAILGYR